MDRYLSNKEAITPRDLQNELIFSYQSETQSRSNLEKLIGDIVARNNKGIPYLGVEDIGVAHEALQLPKNVKFLEEAGISVRILDQKYIPGTQGFADNVLGDKKGYMLFW